MARLDSAWAGVSYGMNQILHDTNNVTAAAVPVSVPITHPVLLAVLLQVQNCCLAQYLRN